jgi:peptidoglycan/xylan/chitin deacetylase (PgdA/CDA1 family)
MRLTILMYHKVDQIPTGVRYPRNYVSPGQFAEQLAALRRWNYETISFDDWVAYRGGAGTLPPRPIILTFDDGYRSTGEIAWPVLRRYDYSATVFVVSDFVGKTNSWDPDEIQEPLLTAEELRALQAEGLRVGSHGKTHGSLRTMSVAAAAMELGASRRALEAITGAPIRTLCYPYGQQNGRVRALAREAGYHTAVVLGRRLNSRYADPLRLRRLWIDFRTELTGLKWTLEGLRLLP